MKCNRVKDIVAAVEVLIVSIGLPAVTFFIGKEQFTAALIMLELTSIMTLGVIFVRRFKLKEKLNAETIPRLLSEGFAFSFWLVVAFWGGYMLFAVINLLVMLLFALTLLMYLLFRYIE